MPSQNSSRVSKRLAKALAACYDRGNLASEPDGDLETLLYRFVDDLDDYPYDDNDRVLRVLGEDLSEEASHQVIQALLNLLHEWEFFDSDSPVAAGRIGRLRAAFEAEGAELSRGGHVTWFETLAPDPTTEVTVSPDSTTVVTDDTELPSAEDIPDYNPTSSSELLLSLNLNIPGIENGKIKLLKQVLKSVPEAAVALTHHRHAGRPAFPTLDEYDWQDLVENALRLIFPDVIPEDSLSKVGHKTPRVDFWIPSLSAIVEVKHSRDKRRVSTLQDEIQKDLVVYGSRTAREGVKHIFYVMYDANRTIANSDAFEKLVERQKNDNGAKNYYLHVQAADAAAGTSSLGHGSSAPAPAADQAKDA